MRMLEELNVRSHFGSEEEKRSSGWLVTTRRSTDIEPLTLCVKLCGLSRI
jgi:hypothetical protein